jgi:hypothetical protein
MTDAKNTAAEPVTLTDADFDLDTMFPRPAKPFLGNSSRDVEIAEEDNRRVLRGRRPSSSKVR